jgi:ABC-type lipoprotein release transport system permease subunit
MRFELFIASRYLRAKRRQAFIGIITGISIIGVAAGVASLVVALAINNGFRQDLQQRLLGSTSHISLQRIADDGIRDWPPLMDRLSKEPHVVAAAPAIFEQVLVSRGPRARGAVLKGMIPKYERQVGDLLNSVKEGSAAGLEGDSHLGRSQDQNLDRLRRGRTLRLRSGQTRPPLHRRHLIRLRQFTGGLLLCRRLSWARKWQIIWEPRLALKSW